MRSQIPTEDESTLPLSPLFKSNGNHNAIKVQPMASKSLDSAFVVNINEAHIGSAGLMLKKTWTKLLAFMLAVCLGIFLVGSGIGPTYFADTVQNGNTQEMHRRSALGICSTDPLQKVHLPFGTVLLTPSAVGQVCVLKDANNQIFGRSYDGHAWESSNIGSNIFSCNRQDQCSIFVREEDGYTLHTYGEYDSTAVLQGARKLASKRARNKAARFLIQATFGPTNGEIEELTSGNDTIRDWIQKQIILPPSLHREYFRKRANPRTIISSHPGRARRACEAGSRWIQFAFSGSDVGKDVRVASVGDFLIFEVDGIGRTRVSSSEWTAVSALSSFRLCSVRDSPGGSVYISSNGCASVMLVQNPPLNMPQVNIPEDRMIPLSEGAQLVEMVAASAGVKVLRIDGGGVLPDCYEPPYGSFFARDSEGALFQHDSRLVLMNNTVDSPAQGYELEYCPNVPRTFVNVEGCVIGGKACTSTKYKSSPITLNDESIRQFQTNEGMYVYKIEGLRMDDVQSPCVTTSSRWSRVSASCTSSVTGATLANFITKLEAEAGNVRQINITKNDVCSAAAGAHVQTKDGCFVHVHPDTDNVYDFSLWALSGSNGHPGNAVAFANNRPNPIVKPSVNGQISITYPSHHPMARWVTYSRSFPLLGRLNSVIDFKTLPATLQTEATAAQFRATIDTDEEDLTEICGSPGEVANDPELGNRFYYAQESNVDVQFPTDNQADFKMDIHNLKTAVWTGLAIKAPDQLRQRVAFALSQILVVSVQQVQGFEDEIYVNYYDIFVRNAFGKYRDVLREVVYSPMMAAMLTYEDNKSLQFCLEAAGKYFYPDENFAREIMQLFTIGLYELNDDGTLKKGEDNKALEAFSNHDVMAFARIFTGFRRRNARANFEGESPTNPRNRMDPMRLDPEIRDYFPKMNLNGGYIGDGYPLCIDLPTNMFLRKGAMYLYLGGSPDPDTIEGDPEGGEDVDATHLELSESSMLFKTLCNKADGKCRYKSQITLHRNLKCKGDECKVDDPRIVKVGNAYYEYVRPACIEFPFFAEGVTVKDKDQSNAICVNKEAVAAGTACCDRNQNAVQQCTYFGELVRYSTAEERCKAKGLSLCNFQAVDSTCGSSGRFWTNSACKVQIKVRNDGYISIIHTTGAEITRSALHEDNSNFFRVAWVDEVPKAENNCLGSCAVRGDECICDIYAEETPAFDKFPTSKAEVLEKLHIGSAHPSTYKGYKKVSISKKGKEVDPPSGVQVRSPKDGKPFSKENIISVKAKDGVRYFRNKISLVHSSTDGRALFRNPANLMNFVETTTRDSEYEIEALLDHLVYHNNTAPFIAYRLIQRFVTSNPSPKYVKVVADAFIKGRYKGVGSKTYGDLGATIAAVLMYKEARNMALDYDPAHGQLREPLLKVIHFIRSMNVSSPYNREIELHEMALKLGEEAHNAPSVFNFFRPEYAPAGPLSEAGLVSPEAQIMTAPKVVNFMNGMISAARFGLTSCQGGFTTNFLPGLECWRIQYETEEKVREMAHAHLDWTPSDGVGATAGEEVIKELSLLLTAGRLENSAKEIILAQYNREAQTNGPLAAMKVAQQLVIGSPEFQVTNHVQRKSGQRRAAARVIRGSNSYKAIVYIFVSGGLDSYNLLVPHSNCKKDMYGEYKSERAGLALELEEILPIDVPEKNQVCDTFGVHHKLPIMRDLYAAGDAAFLSNVGVMVEPITRAEYLSETKRVPDSLFAHNVQTVSTQTINPTSRSTNGVLGRAHDVLSKLDYSPGSFSIFGKNSVLEPQSLNSVNPFYMSRYGINLFNPSMIGTEAEEMNNALLSLSLAESSSLLAETWSSAFESAFNQTQLLSSVLQRNAVDDFKTQPATAISLQLKQVATLIKSRNDLGMDRQAFYVELHGLDTHSSSGEIVAARLNDLNAALTDFIAEIKKQGLWENVAIVQSSEFGRTLTTNGAGTDHAWGGNYMLMGGQVKGKRIVGEYPEDLTMNGPLNIGRGRLIPTTSWDSVWNAVLEWYGVPKESMKQPIPNLENFRDNLLTLPDLFD